MLDKHAAWDAAPECGRRVAASKQRTWWTWSRLPAAQPGPFSGDVTSFTGFALAKQPLPGSAFAEAAGGWRYRGQAGDAGVSASIEPLQAFAFCKWALALLGLADSADVSLSEARVRVSAPSGSRARISKMRARDPPPTTPGRPRDFNRASATMQVRMHAGRPPGEAQRQPRRRRSRALERSPGSQALAEQQVHLLVLRRRREAGLQMGVS